jgi:hypothetical protein
MARFNADLSMIASKAIVASITFLNQSPENRTSLFARTEPARDDPMPFSSRRRFPRHGRTPAKFFAIIHILCRWVREPSFVSPSTGSCAEGRFEDCSDPLSLLWSGGVDGNPISNAGKKPIRCDIAC